MTRAYTDAAEASIIAYMLQINQANAILDDVSPAAIIAVARDDEWRTGQVSGTRYAFDDTLIVEALFAFVQSREASIKALKDALGRK